jgi:RimJ/RimL family protein N-acetyltransferase
MHRNRERLAAEGGSARLDSDPQVAEGALRAATGLTVRSVGASDGPDLRALFDRLSPRSRCFRFLGPKKTLSARELENLVDIDRVARVALALVAPDGRFVAVARYAPAADHPNTAEVALTVADEWQGRGIGTALASLLLAEARRSRIVRLRAMTLADNHASRRLLRGLGFTLSRVDGAVLRFEMLLAPRGEVGFDRDTDLTAG